MPRNSSALPRFAARAACTCAQAGHIGIAQHQADVGMRDQASLRIDDVGVTMFADLDLRDHVPDQLEIDLGNADTASRAGAGNRQRHIRLGLMAEIHRPVIDLVGHGFGELRIRRTVGAAVRPHPWRAATRAAARCRTHRAGELGDGRHLAQQPQASNRRCSIGRADHGICVVQPIWLSISLTNWPILAAAASACSRWMRISDRLVLLILEPDLEQPVGQQRHADDATNSATYLRNSRLRILSSAHLPLARHPQQGAAASVWRSEAPGCSEMPISRNLAGANDFVSCRAAAGSFDDLVGGRKQSWRNLDCKFACNSWTRKGSHLDAI